MSAVIGDHLFHHPQQYAFYIHYILCTLHSMYTTFFVYYIICTLHSMYITFYVHYILCTLHSMYTTFYVHYILCTLHSLHTPHSIYTTFTTHPTPTSAEFNGMVSRLTNQVNMNTDAMLIESQAWGAQIRDAMNVNGGDIENATSCDYFMHFLTFPWKVSRSDGSAPRILVMDTPPILLMDTTLFY